MLIFDETLIEENEDHHLTFKQNHGNPNRN